MKGKTAVADRDTPGARSRMHHYPALQLQVLVGIRVVLHAWAGRHSTVSCSVA